MRSIIVLFCVLVLGLVAVARVGANVLPAGAKAKSADHALIRALQQHRFTDAMKAINQGADVNAVEGGK